MVLKGRIIILPFFDIEKDHKKYLDFSINLAKIDKVKYNKKVKISGNKKNYKNKNGRNEKTK